MVGSRVVQTFEIQSNVTISIEILAYNQTSLEYVAYKKANLKTVKNQNTTSTTATLTIDKLDYDEPLQNMKIVAKGINKTDSKVFKINILGKGDKFQPV